MLNVSWVAILASMADLNLALQFGHSKMAASLVCSFSLRGLREGMGQVLTGAVTLEPQFGQLTKWSPHAIMMRANLKSVMEKKLA
jgi:hypothetical protein